MAEDALGQMGFRFIRDEDGNLISNPDFVQNLPRGPLNRGDIDEIGFGNGTGRGPRLIDSDRDGRGPARNEPVEDPIDMVNFTEGFDFIF
ncbi:hypothetical protein [Falsiphaeobacter marinintestinus]|uniref:hypothetical protein n=1 Tax=Falsiphaeobacter marinintestinus TaxID=1492905 RepID=UPI0011B82309|nr:hypothetical protein [Phaeobacter marinintestinus]